MKKFKDVLNESREQRAQIQDLNPERTSNLLRGIARRVDNLFKEISDSTRAHSTTLMRQIGRRNALGIGKENSKALELAILETDVLLKELKSYRKFTK